MEVLITLIGLGFTILLLVVPLIALVRASKAKSAAKKIEDRLVQLEKHIHSLDAGVGELRNLVARVFSLEHELKTLQEKFAAGVISAPPAPKVAPAPVGAAGEGSPSATSPVPKMAKPEVAAPAAAGGVPAPPPADGFSHLQKGFSLKAEAAVSPAVPVTAVPPSAASPAPGRAKSIFSIEEALGTNWLNKLGIIILVIGIALFLGYQLQHVGPAGKVFVGYLVSLAMLGSGVFFERRERWQILARAGIGGGWALLFFTTYAMNHVPAARVLESESTDFLLLFLVGAAMVVHTLRYQSQVVTGLAFLLAFSIINLTHGSVSSLWAGVILCGGLAWIAVRRSWFELEVMGILAAFLNHYYWLRPMIEPMGRHHHPFPELTASTLLLMSYWLIFRSSYIVRRIETKFQENVSTLAAILNTFLFHGVIAYQAARPELAFSFLLGVGSTEMVLGQLPITKRRRTAFVMLSTIGTILLVSAFSYRYSGGKLSVAWLLEAEALLLAGIFTREILFRRLGLLVSYLVVGHMLFVDAAKLAHARDIQNFDFSDPKAMVIFLVAAAVLYANSHWFLRKFPEPASWPFEKYGTQALSYLGGLMSMLAVWALFPEMWWAVGWMALAFAAAFAGARWKFKELTLQASALALLGAVRATIVNLSDPWLLPGHVWLTRRLIAVAIVAALLYVSARWSEVPEWTLSRRVSQAYAWIGTLLVLTLCWYEFRPISVALAWMLAGLVLFELGTSWRSWSLRLQSYAALAAAFLRMFHVNLNAAGYPGQLSPRFFTTVPLAAAFFYVYWRLEASRGEEFQRDRRFRAAECFSFCAILTVAGLMRFELHADYVAVAWAALTSMLLAVAWRFKKPVFLHQGLLLGLGVLFRCLLHNVYERSYFPGALWHGRMFTVGTTVALLLAGLPFGFKMRRIGAGDAPTPVKWPVRAISGLVRRPEQILFYVPFALLTVLLAAEMRSGLVTLAWGIEAVCIFLFALWVGERSFRLTGMALLLVCAAKIVVMDVWSLQARDRYLTFIVLGIALTGVSFLYTRYRETLRHYL